MRMGLFLGFEQHQEQVQEQRLEQRLEQKLVQRQELELPEDFSPEKEDLIELLDSCPQEDIEGVNYVIGGGWAVDMLTGINREHHDIDIVKLNKVPEHFSFDKVTSKNYFGIFSMSKEEFENHTQVVRWEERDVIVPGNEYLFFSKIAGFLGPRREKDLDDLASLSKLEYDISRFRELIDFIPDITKGFQRNARLFGNLMSEEHKEKDVKDLAAKYLMTVISDFKSGDYRTGRRKAERFYRTLNKIYHQGLKNAISLRDYANDLAIDHLWENEDLEGFWTKDKNGVDFKVLNTTENKDTLERILIEQRILEQIGQKARVEKISKDVYVGMLYGNKKVYTHATQEKVWGPFERIVDYDEFRIMRGSRGVDLFSPNLKHLMHFNIDTYNSPVAKIIRDGNAKDLERFKRITGNMYHVFKDEAYREFLHNLEINHAVKIQDEAEIIRHMEFTYLSDIVWGKLSEAKKIENISELQGIDFGTIRKNAYNRLTSNEQWLPDNDQILNTLCACVETYGDVDTEEILLRTADKPKFFKEFSERTSTYSRPAHSNYLKALRESKDYKNDKEYFEAILKHPDAVGSEDVEFIYNKVTDFGPWSNTDPMKILEALSPAQIGSERLKSFYKKWFMYDSGKAKNFREKMFPENLIVETFYESPTKFEPEFKWNCLPDNWQTRESVLEWLTHNYAHHTNKVGNLLDEVISQYDFSEYEIKESLSQKIAIIMTRKSERQGRITLNNIKKDNRISYEGLSQGVIRILHENKSYIPAAKVIDKEGLDKEEMKGIFNHDRQVYLEAIKDAYICNGNPHTIDTLDTLRKVSGISIQEIGDYLSEELLERIENGNYGTLNTYGRLVRDGWVPIERFEFQVKERFADKPKVKRYFSI